MRMAIYNFLRIVSIPMDVVVALSTAFAFAIRRPSSRSSCIDS